MPCCYLWASHIRCNPPCDCKVNRLILPILPCNLTISLHNFASNLTCWNGVSHNGWLDILLWNEDIILADSKPSAIFFFLFATTFLLLDPTSCCFNILFTNCLEVFVFAWMREMRNSWCAQPKLILVWWYEGSRRVQLLNSKVKFKTYMLSVHRPILWRKEPSFFSFLSSKDHFSTSYNTKLKFGAHWTKDTLSTRSLITHAPLPNLWHSFRTIPTSE